MFRLALPIFLLAYPFAFTVQLILSSSFPSGGGSSVPDFLLTMAWTLFISVGWGTAAGVIGGIVRGISWGIKGGLVGSLVGGIAWAGAWFIVVGTKGAIGGGVEVASVFLVSYMAGYYRLPLYPVSGLSGLKTFFASKKSDSGVFSPASFLPLLG